MEIKQFVEPLLKWWKLILVACLLAGASSYWVVRQQPPTYQTSVVLVIGRAVYDPNPTGGELGLATQLAAYYSNIVQREVVRSGTMSALGISSLPSYTVQSIPNSQILEIAVTDTDPARAQAVANELANQLIKQTPSNPDLQAQKHQQFIQEQINLLEAQIQETLDEIAAKESELGGLNSARQIAQTQSEIMVLRQKLTTLQSNYASLLQSSTGQAQNSLSILQPAALPIRPIGMNNMITILLSVAIAFLISAGAAYLIEFLDDTFEASEDVNKSLGLPVVGFIPEIKGGREDRSNLVIRDPKTMEAEAFRALRMNIDFLQVHAPIKTLLVASVGKTEGKSMIATNLARAMARGGKQVLLLDADLRRPSLHKYLNLSNDVGLSSIFLQDVSIDEAKLSAEVENLAVITTGVTPPNPGELITSPRMDDILRDLGAQADIVILDGPPVLVTDATILASKVDAVLLVLGANRTRRAEATIALKQLERADANVIGAVLNRVSAGRDNYYRLYQYDYGLEPSKKRKHLRIGKMNILLPELHRSRRRSDPKRASELERSEPVIDQS
jgi:capsular exopolysaccharide synthesis family protein